MDYTVMSNHELQREIGKICKVYADRQDYRQAKASGAKERLYNILKIKEPYGRETDHVTRLRLLTLITTFEFLQYRNAGLSTLARAVYELEELGLNFKDDQE